MKKCAGVPLAVRTLGIFVRDSELWDIEQKKDDILPALKLSYDQMPSYLKQCFVYFSLYPKDYIFNSNDITWLWVALGLVQSQNGSEQLNDTGREHIHELNTKSFLQDFKNRGYDDSFKLHDLIHDLVLYVVKEECAVVNSHTGNIPEHVRHLPVVENNSADEALFTKSKSLKTILFPVK